MLSPIKLTLKRMHFDDILNEIGIFGFYQKRIFTLLAFPSMSAGSIVLVVYAVLATPIHRCKIPSMDNDTYAIQGANHAELITENIPLSDDPTLLYDKCHVYTYSGIYEGNLSGSNNSYVNATLERCNAWVYDETVFEDTFSSINNLVCGDTLKTSHIQMFLFFGILSGASVLGPISDSIGRKKTMCIAWTTAALLGIGVAFSPGVYVYAALQFLLGALSHGAFLAIAVFVMEIVGPTKRLWTGMLIQVCFTFGICYVALVAFLLRSWRWVTLAVAIPAVPYIGLWCIVPESPRWLISKSRKEEALDVINTMSKTNKHTSVYTIHQISDVHPDYREGNLWHLFKSPILLRRTLILMFNWMVVSMTYYGVTLTAGNLGGDYYLNFFLLAFVEIPATFYGIYVIHRFGRRVSMASTMILCGLACLSTIPTAVIGNDSLQPLVITLAIIGKAFSAGAFAIVYMYTAELLPTVVRNSSMGACSCGARIGGMIAPYVAKSGELIGGKFGKVEPLVVFGSLSIIAGLLILPLPETINRKLPDTIQDGEQFGRREKKLRLWYILMICMTELVFKGPIISLKGVCLTQAARIYRVPETTLRSSGRIRVDSNRPGSDSVISYCEEEQLTYHVKYVANIGYCYSKANIQHMARDFALSLGKTVKGNNKLSNNWFNSLNPVVIKSCQLVPATIYTAESEDTVMVDDDLEVPEERATVVSEPRDEA